MYLLKAICSRLVFKSLCSVITGAVTVTMFAFLLNTYGASKDEKITKITEQQIAFPKNQQMLDQMARVLENEGKKLSAIEPAAGNADNNPAAAPDSLQTKDAIANPAN